MTNRERVAAILHYEKADQLPVVHFGFWQETLDKWCEEGHLTKEEADGWWDGSRHDTTISEKLGFDFNWGACFSVNTSLFPAFEKKVVKDFGDGTRHIQDHEGVILLEKDGAGSIPAEIEHLLVDRASWEELYLPKMQFAEERINLSWLETLRANRGDNPIGLYIGSLYGTIRNWLGVVGSSYLLCDDEELFTEIIDTMGDMCYRVTEAALKKTANIIQFDYAHFWEDICFKNGPLISPAVFAEKVGPHYKRIAELLNKNGIDIISVDCDGCIDALLPVWLQNGINTMFPIEVGTWDASIAPWREQYGKELRGIGGMNKTVFAADFDAVEAEIQRLKPLVALGGYIPCPDHRIAPDAKWENVVYYTRRMREVFQK